MTSHPENSFIELKELNGTNVEIRHSDWMLQVMGLVLTNQELHLATQQ